MLTPDAVFAAANSVALVAWTALAVSMLVASLRRYVWPATGLVLPAVFAVAYLGSLAAGFAAGEGGGFGSIAEVRRLFANDAALTAGWVHYLAFDLMVGTWIARDAVRASVPAIFTLPALVLTFLFGPAGLLTHVVVRLSRGGAIKEILS